MVPNHDTCKKQCKPANSFEDSIDRQQSCLVFDHHHFQQDKLQRDAGGPSGSQDPPKDSYPCEITRLMTTAIKKNHGLLFANSCTSTPYLLSSAPCRGWLAITNASRGRSTICEGRWPTSQRHAVLEDMAVNTVSPRMTTSKYRSKSIYQPLRKPLSNPVPHDVSSIACPRG